MAAKMAAVVAAAVAVTAVAAGDRRNWTVAAVAAVPERGVLPAERERGRQDGTLKFVPNMNSHNH